MIKEGETDEWQRGSEEREERRGRERDGMKKKVRAGDSGFELKEYWQETKPSGAVFLILASKLTELLMLHAPQRQKNILH